MLFILDIVTITCYQQIKYVAAPSPERFKNEPAKQQLSYAS